MYDRVCTHSPVARTFFLLHHLSAHIRIFMRVHIHAWLKCLKKVHCTCVTSLHIAFSLLMSHPSSLLFLHGRFETTPVYDLTGLRHPQVLALLCRPKCAGHAPLRTCIAKVWLPGQVRCQITCKSTSSASVAASLPPWFSKHGQLCSVFVATQKTDGLTDKVDNIFCVTEAATIRITCGKPHQNKRGGMILSAIVGRGQQQLYPSNPEDVPVVDVRHRMLHIVGRTCLAHFQPAPQDTRNGFGLLSTEVRSGFPDTPQYTSLTTPAKTPPIERPLHGVAAARSPVRYRPSVARCSLCADFS